MEQSNQRRDGPTNNNKAPQRKRQSRNKTLATVSLAALGIVYGDIGTSPLYAIRECFHGEFGIAPTQANILGVLSLIFWALTIVVSLKYLTFMVRADHQGEGGVMALTSLLKGKAARSPALLIGLGLFAACLLYGDGMITPAISVLSAVEGIRIITPVFEPFVIPATVVILTGLFLLQRRGTARIGALFGPIILLWFATLATLGLIQIIKYPRVFEAVFPWHGLSFLIANKLPGFLVLGAVFLVVTGAEALYADLGHFGKQPIRVSWIIPVLPCLILNYFGQGALLIQDPNQVAHPFYAMVPTWAMIPMVMLATTATIIASQAVIAGTFSLTRQAVQLGYLPRLRIRHTSSSHIGQIYVPFVNWGLWLATTLLVITIQSSSKLAAAYGVAVTSTMLIASILFFVVARQIWKWKLLPAAALTGLFLLVDIAFFSANITKILHGAWIPLMIGGVLFMLMTVWRGGRTRLAEQFRSTTISWEQFIQSLEATEISRVAGQAIYLSGSPGIVPSVLLNNMKHNQVLHSQVASLHITTETVPRVDNDEKVEIIEHGKNFFSIIARYGFMESPDIVNILSLARQQSVTFDIDKTSFFLGRERLLTSGGNGMRLWGKRIFSFLSRNALDASAFYNIPSNRIIEIGIQLKL